jgi:hypothetical protein
VTLAITLVVLAVVISAVAGYLNWIAGRHERLASRADAAWAALDAQLVRRAAAAHTRSLALNDAGLREAAEASLVGGEERREDTENALGRALRRSDQGDSGISELHDIAGRVHLARQFHNDAVRDLAALRRRRVTRLLRLGRGDHVGPGRVFFEIDDTVGRGPSSPAAG